MEERQEQASDNKELPEFARPAQYTDANNIQDSQNPKEGNALYDDVVGFIDVPRYALPNVTSLLPHYANSEQDYIFRTFHTGNYDALRILPDNIKPYEITKARLQNFEHEEKIRAKTIVNKELLIKNQTLYDDEDIKPCGKSGYQGGLFTSFNYVSDRFELQDEERRLDAMKHKAAQLQVSSQPFIPSNTVCAPKYDDPFNKGSPFPYLAHPYEDAFEDVLKQRWYDESKILYGPFTMPGVDKLTETPSKQQAYQMIKQIHKIITDEWNGLDLVIYPNSRQQWVIRVGLGTAESTTGLIAYMNVFFRYNALISKYQIKRVVEHWAIQPGDGYMYFTVQPPWVSRQPDEAFYGLFPEEKTHKSSKVYKAMTAQKNKQAQKLKNLEKQQLETVRQPSVVVDEEMLKIIQNIMDSA